MKKYEGSIHNDIVFNEDLKIKKTDQSELQLVELAIREYEAGRLQRIETATMEDLEEGRAFVYPFDNE